MGFRAYVRALASSSAEVLKTTTGRQYAERVSDNLHRVSVCLHGDGDVVVSRNSGVVRMICFVEVSTRDFSTPVFGVCISND